MKPLKPLESGPVSVSHTLLVVRNGVFACLVVRDEVKSVDSATVDVILCCPPSSWRSEPECTTLSVSH